MDGGACLTLCVPIWSCRLGLLDLGLTLDRRAEAKGGRRAGWAARTRLAPFIPVSLYLFPLLYLSSPGRAHLILPHRSLISTFPSSSPQYTPAYESVTQSL